MPVKLKRVSDQVIVITGASSGIGLATAEMAVQRGARVVLAARSEEELRDTCDRLNRTGKRATYVAAEVAEHARKHIPEQAKHTPPVYPPEEVAHAILRCAEKPIREVVVGGVPRLQQALHTLAPRLTDLYMEHTAISGQRQQDEPANADDAL